MAVLTSAASISTAALCAVLAVCLCAAQGVSGQSASREVSQSTRPLAITRRISSRTGMNAEVVDEKSWSAESEALLASNSLPNTSAAVAGTAAKFGSKGIANLKQGPVMNKPIGVYLIWVGSFTGKQKKLVRDFIQSLSPNSNKSVTVDNWWAINTRYYGGKLVKGKPTGGTVSNKVTLKAEHSGSAASFGFRKKVITDVFGVVKQAIRAKKWPSDPNSLYAVFSDKATIQKGAPGSPAAISCVDYCGWHSYSSFRKQQLKYLWQGVPQCTGCGSYLLASNGGPYITMSLDSGIHQAISTFAHEIAEAASDPYLTSWYDAKGYENADKCQLYFGELRSSRLKNGNVGVYNLVGVHGQKYLIQQNWDPVTGSCVSGV